jgi:hypothetical protein
MDAAFDRYDVSNTGARSRMGAWCRFRASQCTREEDVRLAQSMRAGPCIPVGIQL